MENSRLPIEVCECVIDECFYFDGLPDRKTLRACALTCSQWLPRSQYNLYHELRVQNNKSAGSIVDTLTARPELAEHVRGINIWPNRCYVPLTQVLSIPSLKKCQILEMSIGSLIDFPPRYVQNCLIPSLTKFESVVKLYYEVQSTASAIGIFHIIWAMPQLMWCELNCEDTLTLAASSLDNLKKTALKINPRLRLNTLVLDIVNSNMPHIQGYPPQGAFGSLANLTTFDFAFTTAAPVSDSFLQFLGEMVSLEEFAIAVCFKDYTPGGADPLAQVLRYMRSSHLKKCDIQFWTIDQYGCKRGDMVEIISGEAMKQRLQRLPSIPEFIIRVDENDAAFNKDWWTTEITKNLPALKDTLTVHVDAHIYENEDLWMEDLPAEAASSINTENSTHINSDLHELSGLSEDPYPTIDRSNLEDNTVTETVGALQVIE